VFYRIRIHGFQSLGNADMRLGRLNVVTGPSNSGKSAIIRAMHMLAFNAPGHAFVTRGEKLAAIEVSLAEPDRKAWALGLERGARGSDKYVLAPPVHADDPEPVDDDVSVTYTKLGGKVPPDISRMLRVSSLNFSLQHDPPFLLSATGSEVARTLGALTNITLIHNAAREGNRRKLAEASRLRDRESELATLRQQAASFRGIGDRRAAMRHAEEAMEAALYLRARADRFMELYSSLAAAEVYLRELPASADLPSVEGIVAAARRLARFRELHLRITTAGRDEMDAAKMTADISGIRQQAEAELQALKSQMTICPTCGRAM
jgi:DNA repair protein SbcC/Rad50